MPHQGNLQRQNSKVTLQPAAIEAARPLPLHRPLFLINTGDCCLTASDSRIDDAARADARKLSGWSSSIQHPYRPLGVIAPVILPYSFKKKGNTGRSGHAQHAVAPLPPAPPLATSTAASDVPPHLVPRPPSLQLPLHKVVGHDGGISASARGGGGGGVSSRRQLVEADTSQRDAAALDSFRYAAKNE
jgi:hypothetical protein